MSDDGTVIRRPRRPQGDGKNLHRDPLGDELRARALAFTDALVTEAGEVLTKGMRGELPGSDAREQRLCAQAIRAERVPSASSQPALTPRIEVRIASFAQIQPRSVDSVRMIKPVEDGSPRWQRGSDASSG